MSIKNWSSMNPSQKKSRKAKRKSRPGCQNSLLKRDTSDEDNPQQKSDKLIFDTWQHHKTASNNEKDHEKKSGSGFSRVTSRPLFVIYPVTFFVMIWPVTDLVKVSIWCI